jgi:competence protein ComFB
MPIRDEYRFDELKNVAEDVIIDELERQLKELPPETELNEELVLDMCAFAFNLTKPMYRANLLGRMYASAYAEEHSAEIKTAVSTAIKKILSGDS